MSYSGVEEYEPHSIRSVSYTHLDVYKRQSWKKLFAQFIRTDLQLKLFSSPTLKVVSEVDEDERDFRIRLQHLAHEKRDEALDALRKKYASKINTLEDRQRRAKQALEKQSTRACLLYTSRCV